MIFSAISGDIDELWNIFHLHQLRNSNNTKGKENIIFVLMLCLTPVLCGPFMFDTDMYGPEIWRLFPSGFIYDLFGM